MVATRLENNLCSANNSRAVKEKDQDIRIPVRSEVRTMVRRCKQWLNNVRENKQRVGRSTEGPK